LFLRCESDRIPTCHFLTKGCGLKNVQKNHYAEQQQ